VLAAGMEHVHDHQFRVAKEPFLGPCGSFGDAGQRSEVLVARQTSQMFAADAREARDLVLGENPLARLDSDHRRALRFLRCFRQINRRRNAQQ
jgi:hypothetical protein